MQINTLVEQYNDKEPKERIKYVFCVNYPFRHWLKVELGEMFMKLGAVMSAFQEFEVVQMWEEAVECLIMGSQFNKAADLAREKLEERKTPRMLCALGDITGEMSLYLEAWELSSHRCTRAQRTLARREFDKNNFAQAIEHYKKALEINPLYPNAWFTLGCTYMKLQQWNNACGAFQRLICIDSNLAEAWNNLSACHMTIGNYSEAYDALVHGIKHDRNNWKMLENLLILSVQLSKYYTAIDCIQCLMNIGQLKLFDSDLFGMINKIANGKEHKLEETYKKIVNNVNVGYGVWRCYASFIEENLALGGEFNKEKVLDLRIKACRNAANKELNRKTAEDLEELTRELARAYGRIDDEKVRYEGKLYLNSLCKKIKDILGKEVEINILEFNS